MFNPHTKFKGSTITCNEYIKGNAKCKNYYFQPPFRRHNVHLLLDVKRIVNILLVIIELFLLALTAEALLSEIC